MGRVIPRLGRALKEWHNYQSPRTMYEWAFALHVAGFMDTSDITEVESVLEAAMHSGEWDMADPLSAANEFLTAAKHTLIHDATDKLLHEAVAKALYDELFLLIGTYMFP